MKQAHSAFFKYLVAVSAGAHFAYLIYVPSGGFLALRWPRTIWLHVASVCWGVAVVTLPLPCPLTSLEDWARARAEMKPLPSTGFIDRYVAGVIYPADRTGTAQALAFLAAAVSWLALAKKAALPDVFGARLTGTRLGRPRPRTSLDQEGEQT